MSRMNGFNVYFRHVLPDTRLLQIILRAYQSQLTLRVPVSFQSFLPIHRRCWLVGWLFWA